MDGMMEEDREGGGGIQKVTIRNMQGKEEEEVKAIRGE